MSEWSKLKQRYYGKHCRVQTEYGNIDFSPGMERKVENANLSYDEYLDIMSQSMMECREWFQICYYDSLDTNFTGEIERISHNKVCFRRIYVEGFYFDGEGFFGREDHVWFQDFPLEGIQVGDRLSFSAEVYMYLKTGKGKRIDYALRKPENIRKVDDYHFPTDEDLHRQFADQLICEVCLFHDHCNGLFCMANDAWLEGMRELLY